MVMYDLATKWRDAAPSAEGSIADAVRALRFFAGIKDDIKSFHSDSAPELRYAAEVLE